MAAKVKTHMSVKEVATAAGISPVTVTRRIADCTIPATKSDVVGRGRAAYQIPIADAKIFIKNAKKAKK